MRSGNIGYLAVDLFCTLEEIRDREGLRGRVAGVLYRFLFPAGRAIFGEDLMFDIRLKGPDLRKDYED